MLVKFDPENKLVEFVHKDCLLSSQVGFTEFRSLRLTQPTEMKRIALIQEQQLVPAAASPTQRCVVNFKDGDSLMAETMGYVEHPFGLFLFLRSYDDEVLRWFIPASAISSYRIGEHLGRMLVEGRLVSQDAVDLGLKKQEALRTRKLGDYLQKQQILSQEQVEKALHQQKELPHIRLGEALLQEGLITQEQLEQALAMQTHDRKTHLGEILVEMDVVKRDTLRRVLAQKLGIPLVSLRKFDFDLNLIKSVPADLVRKYQIMPLYRTETRMVVALENPLAIEGLQALGFYTKLKIDPVMASADDLSGAIRKFYGSQASRESMEDLVFELGGTDLVTPASTISVMDDVSESDNTLVRLVNKIIMDAYEDGASDIHIETMKGNRPTQVRFRKEGLMSHYSDIPANFRNALVSRLKIMSRLDISEKRRSQDGKIDFSQFGPARIELRVLTMPTTEGLEDVVMRILSAPKAVSLDGLGLSPSALEGIRKIAARPHGLLFVCGPTGSGKTTTLHSILAHINTPDRKIWTVEDPVEITQEGLRQVQVQPRIDWTFAAVLRSFLRADPDVIMVGETRDAETARTVIEASLTGHLVFSTMHTNSAAESVVRLLDLGLDPFNFGDALLGVIGQRLTRRLCVSCRIADTASDEELAMLAYEYCLDTALSADRILADWHATHAGPDGKMTLHRARGCEECNGSGYKGRLGIHELLVNSGAIKRMILNRASVAEITAQAMQEGMATMRQDGIAKILQGYTDWEQVRTLTS
ncbi:ATPase, T2SS/T4P/T4SS family [Noviherbaspirillum sp. 1P10PC]|uniref:ATPase, T2SS/T4P/T4SS family n=1 Tax=Noviherbaspirillum sp. 1P10PC TaxID=3132292 RepID=UPI0039A07724